MRYVIGTIYVVYDGKKVGSRGSGVVGLGCDLWQF